MGEPQRRCRRRRPAPASSNGGSGEDRISGLPDELLHDILVRLRSAHAAARTSVLSRRWRHVWAHLPELRFVAPPAAAAVPASFMGSVNAALGGYLGLTLELLGVSISTKQLGLDLRVPSGRIARWLHFAAEHVVGELYPFLLGPRTSRPEVLGEEVVLELPVCERAKQIVFFLEYERATWLRPQASGLFTALTCLRIGGNVRMEGSDIIALVNTRCPCLRDLSLSIQLIVIFDVFIHSNSLHTLMLHVLETRRLEILATRLEELTIITKPMEAHISAPQLVKVSWHDAYDPHLHRFVDVGRTLQLLKTLYRASSLAKRFDEVDVLDMNINVNFPDVATYGRLLNETNKLPKCKRFNVFLTWDYHALVPIMLQLLRSCNCTKKFRVELFGDWSWSTVKHSCRPPCPCRLEESRKIDGIDLSSIEEVEIIGFSGSHEQLELVEFVSSNAGILKRLVIIDRFCHRSKEACAKVRSMCHPNVRVQFYGFRDCILKACGKCNVRVFTSFCTIGAGLFQAFSGFIS